jgi:hypothetical protein
MCYLLLIHTQMVVLREINVCLEIHWRGLIGGSRAYLDLETPNWQEAFLENLPQFSRKSGLPIILLQGQMGVCGEIHAFLQLSSIGLFATTWPFLHNEKYDFQTVFLGTLTQFSQGNSVLEPPASNKTFSWSETCVSSLKLTWPSGQKKRLCPTWTP